MRHRRDTLKLGRTSSHRKAMFRNMVTSLFKYDRIRTTDIKAKELRRWADQMVTLAKRGDLHARRLALSIIRERDVVQKLFDEAAKRYGTVSGGYTRIVKVGRRPGDASPMSIVELITESDMKKKETKKRKKTAKKAAKKAAKPAAPKSAKKEAPKAETGPEEAEAAVEKDATEAETTSEETEAAASGEEAAEDKEAPGDEAPKPEGVQKKEE